MDFNELPTKRGPLDWSLGPGARQLSEDTRADYALFVCLRDSYASGGRVALAVLMAAAAGIVVPTGVQVGFRAYATLRDGFNIWQ